MAECERCGQYYHDYDGDEIKLCDSCKDYYKNENGKDEELYKEFDYDYMIYLRDRALTRAKINNSIFDKNNNDEFIENLKKEEKIILRNNQLFIEKINELNSSNKLAIIICKDRMSYYSAHLYI